MQLFSLFANFFLLWLFSMQSFRIFERNLSMQYWAFYFLGFLHRGVTLFPIFSLWSYLSLLILFKLVTLLNFCSRIFSVPFLLGFCRGNMVYPTTFFFQHLLLKLVSFRFWNNGLHYLLFFFSPWDAGQSSRLFQNNLSKHAVLSFSLNFLIL